MTFLGRLAHAWNAFTGVNAYRDVGDGFSSYGRRPDRLRTRFSTDRSMVSAIYTRMSIDAAQVEFRHVRRDADDRYVEDIDSGLNNCLRLEANIDQAARDFRQDVVLTMFDQGVAAIVPVDTTLDPSTSGGFDIKTLRVGEVVTWHPQHVRVRLYNEAKGIREEITLEKKFVAIVPNPLYSVMNEPNSTLSMLIRTLNRLDAIGEQSASGKLDIIIQLPYAVKSEARRTQAKQRREDMEAQLMGSKYGVAYSDATEKITQLNRPAENNLLAQVEYLTKMLYGQLGVTEEVMNGTADEATMINYNNRTVEPIVNAIAEAMRRTFLTKTARSQKQSVDFFMNPLKHVPLSQIADIADKLVRNQVGTANDIRDVIGWKPSKDASANKLSNPNMPQPADPSAPPAPPPTPPPQMQLQRSSPPPGAVGKTKQNIGRGQSQ